MKKIFWLILLSLCFISISVSIGMLNGEKHAREEINESLIPAITITEDIVKLQTYYQNNKEIDIKPVSKEIIEEIGALNEVEYYEYSTPSYMEVKNLKTINLSDDIKEYSTVALRGTNKIEMFPIKVEKIKLEEGRLFTQKEIDQGQGVAIISKDFAKLNNIKIDDVIHNEVNVRSHLNDKSTEINVDLKIIGFYSLNEEPNPREDSKKYRLNQKSNDLNTFFVPNQFSKEVNNKQEKALFNNFPNDYIEIIKGMDDIDTPEEFLNSILNEEYYEVVYLLKSQEVEKSFIKQARPILEKQDYFKFLSNSNKFNYLTDELPNIPTIFKSIIFTTFIFVVLLTSLFLIPKDKLKNSKKNILLYMLTFLIIAILSLFIGYRIYTSLPYHIIFPELRIDGDIHELENKHYEHENEDSQEGEPVNLSRDEIEMLEKEMDKYAYERMDKHRISLREITNAYVTELNAYYILTYFIIITISLFIGYLFSINLRHFKRKIDNY